MITPRNAYSSVASASHAVKQPSRDRRAAPDLRLLTGRSLHYIRRELVGTFAGAVGPDAPVGTFAGVRALRRQGSGTLAGDADSQRQGSFADADRVMIVTYTDGTERSRDVGLLVLQRLLRDLGNHDNVTRPVLDQLFTGHTVVLVEVAVILPSDADALLDRLEQAA
jgi:hypothetical protein